MNAIDYDLSYEDESDIQKLLLGRRIVATSFTDHTITLNNGTVIRVIPNEGGCSCGSGDYELTSLATVDNIITDVRIVNSPSDDYGDGEGYRIFVVADAAEINVLQVDGNDGSGYYGTGYSLHIRVPESIVINEEPV